MNKLCARLTVSAVVLAAVAGAVVVGGPTSANAEPATIHLVARQTQAVEVPAPGPGHLLGARFVASDDLFRNGTMVGRGGRSCEAVAAAPDDESGRFQCVVTLALRDGMITAQALPKLSSGGVESFVAVVTGGTGRYLGASGRADVTPLSETRIDLVIHLS